MGRVWLCTGKIAEHPLALEEEGIGLYSLEELCYYLYWNAELVEESFFNEKLCRWLEEELGEGELSQEIRAGIDREESGCWCMEQILSFGGFYSQEELQQVLQAVSWMEDKGALERAKLRGDRLLKEGRCREAVLAYKRALQMADEMGVDGSQEGAPGQGQKKEGVFEEGIQEKRGQAEGRAEGDSRTVGRIWHNMGTAYAYHMLFGQAAYCYGRAYETGQEEESKQDYLMALSCRDGKVPEGGTDSLAEQKKALLEKKQSGDWAGYEKALRQTLESLRTEYRERE